MTGDRSGKGRGGPPGMRVDRPDQERRLAVSQTRARVSRAIGASIEEHELSYAEILLALAEESATWAGYQMRHEVEAELAQVRKAENGG